VTPVIEDMTGRTVLVTGATDGHGRALARALVESGATLLVHGRDESRIAAAVDELRGAAPDGDSVRSYRADLASLADVERMAAELIANEPRSSAGQMPLDFDNLMFERGYDGVSAYCQSKLAQIMHAIDLSERFEPAQLTANALHPATYMPTKIVPSPISSLEEGVEATFRLVAGKELEGVSGRYFNGKREARADGQAYDRDARARLAAVSRELVDARR
jgi:NAD(P)-dependent dehydrogenase (short-subunit alcohol dehydrogenase family)